MLRYINPSRAYVQPSPNRPEENDETDGESSLLKSSIQSFDFVSTSVPRNFCSNDGKFSNYSGSFSQLPSHSEEHLTEDGDSFHVAAAAFRRMNVHCNSRAGQVAKCGESEKFSDYSGPFSQPPSHSEEHLTEDVDSFHAAAAAFRRMNVHCNSRAGQVAKCGESGKFSNYSGPFSQPPSHSEEHLTDVDSFHAAAAAFRRMNVHCNSRAGQVAKCGETNTLESAANWLSNPDMTDLSPNRSFRSYSPVSSHDTLGLLHLEPGFPLQSSPLQLPDHFLPQNPCRHRVSVYVPEPGHFPPTPPGRVDPNPHWTPGFIPGNVSSQRAVAPTDPVNTNAPFSLPLPREQRKVFVTYATDNDKHVEEVINFVSLLIRNGFQTQIDIFEQHFKSINKIDWMERYINDKGYLIIIVISPKYYEAVTSQNFDIKDDEHSLNTVFIYKQLQNEFIQNGSKNFRFVPIIFPGAYMRHVPSWLQNTHVYSWPLQSQDILRRLMRLEKYNPPPVGELPTIIQKSI